MVLKRNTGWVGFDVGGSIVKAAQAVRIGGEYRIGAAAIAPRRDRWNADALTADAPLPSADELRAAASTCSPLVGRSAAAVLPMVLCEAVQVNAEAARRSNPGDFAALVEAELHQSLEGYKLGSWPAQLQTDKLNVITVPNVWSERISGDVSAGRWNCRGIESLPWALARALTMSDRTAAQRSVAALDWGYGRATLTLVHKGVPALVRCLKDCGFQNVLSAIETALRLTTRDVEALLFRRGQQNANGGVVWADILAQPLRDLERELRRTLGYWHGQSRGQKPESLVLFGGGAALPGVADKLAGVVELPVHVWNLPPADPQSAASLPPAYLLGPALAASAIPWEATWPAA